MPWRHFPTIVSLNFSGFLLSDCVHGLVEGQILSDRRSPSNFAFLQSVGAHLRGRLCEGPVGRGAPQRKL